MFAHPVSQWQDHAFARRSLIGFAPTMVESRRPIHERVKTAPLCARSLLVLRRQKANYALLTVLRTCRIIGRYITAGGSGLTHEANRHI